MKIDEIKARAARERGDDVCLAALERARVMQAKQGYYRVAKPKQFAGRGAPSKEPTREDVVTPGPGWGDVGSGPRPSWRDPRPLGDSLGAIIARGGWSTQLAVAKLRTSWPQIVGENVAKHAHPTTFADGVLTIEVSSRSWAVNLRNLLPYVEKAVADSLGSGIVERILVTMPK